MSHAEDNKRLAKNTIALYIRTLVVLLMQLFVTRLILRALGVDDFGIYNVVGSVVVLFSFLNNAMASASQRFITYELGHGTSKSVIRVFSASMTAQITIAIIMFILLGAVGYYMLNYSLNIPSNKICSANWVFLFSMVTFSFQIVRVPFDGSVIAYEKMTFFAYASIIEVFIKLGIAVSLLYSIRDRLILYSALLTVNAFIMFFLYSIYCKKKFDTCKFQINRDKDLYKRLFSYTGWTLFGSATNILTNQGFVFLINIFYGVIVNAAIGIANQVSGALKSFIGSFQTSYSPQIVKSYAQADIGHLNNLIITTSKMSFALIIIPSLILIFNMPLALHLWLGNVPQYAVEFCQMMIICSIIDATTGPYNTAIMATDNIRNYQLAIGFIFLLDLVVSFILIKIGIQPYLVLISRLATRGIMNMIIGLEFIKNKVDFPIGKYLRSCILPIIGMSVIMVPVLIYAYNKFNGLILLGITSFFIVVTSIICIYYMLFDKQEKIYFLGIINSKFTRNII